MKPRHRLARVLVLLLALAVVFAACGGDDDGSTEAGTDRSATANDDDETLGSASEPPKGCPTDAATVASIVGRQLPQDPDVSGGVIGGSCRFSDGQATVEILVQGAESGEALFETNKEMTAREFGEPVKDLKRGKRGFVATNDSQGEVIAARALVITDKASYNVSLNGFVGFDRAKYEQAATGLIDAVLK